MNRGFHYWTAGVGLMSVAVIFYPGVVSILAAWAAGCCLYVGLGYFLKRGELFFKSSRGRVPRWMKLLLGPVVVFTHAYHWFMRRADQSPPVQKIETGLYLGRRLIPGDEDMLRAEGITAILDVTVEFDGLPERCREAVPHYMNIPVYDHHVPRRSQMARALRWIEDCRRRGESVLIHCALGQGRSVLILLGYLMWENREESLDQLLDRVKAVRYSVKPNARQRGFLEKFREEMPRRMRRKTALIFNPAAGRCRALGGRDALEEIHERLGPFLDFEVFETEEGTPIADTTRRALESKPEQILVCGGDGTVSAVAAELMGNEIPVGILPGGTANALATCLFEDRERGDLFDESCRRILEGRLRALDAGICNGKPFFLLVGIGWEAGMVKGAHRDLKARWGALAYLLSGLEQLRELEDFAVDLEVDGHRREFRATNVVVANTVPQFSLFAQGSDLEPEVDDGWLNLTAVVNVKNRLEGARVIAELIQSGLGLEAKSENILSLRGKKMRIRTDPQQRLVRDGELEPEGVVEIEVREKALRVFA